MEGTSSFFFFLYVVFGCVGNIVSRFFCALFFCSSDFLCIFIMFFVFVLLVVTLITLRTHCTVFCQMAIELIKKKWRVPGG